MCHPAVPVVLAAASTAVTAYGQYEEGQATREAMEYQAAVSRNNAIMEDRRAQEEIARGEQEASQRRRQIARLIGQQRANIGASGVEASGSVLDVVADTAEQGVSDLEMIRINAEQRARDRRYNAQNMRAQADLQQMQGRNAARAGTLSAFGTVLGGAGSLAGSGKLGGLFGGGSPNATSVPKSTRG